MAHGSNEVNGELDCGPNDDFGFNLPSVGTRYSRQAKEIRDEFKNFFCNEGAVEWQNEHI